jgi:hypothetical protein
MIHASPTGIQAGSELKIGHKTALDSGRYRFNP